MPRNSYDKIINKEQNFIYKMLHRRKIKVCINIFSIQSSENGSKKLSHGWEYENITK